MMGEGDYDMDIVEFVKRARRNGARFENRKAVRALRPVHHTINERGAYAVIFTTRAVEGKIGVIVEGMDCDCTQYRREFVMDVPASLMAFQRAEDEHYMSLDGPESTTYTAPRNVNDGYRASADRALEAFEEGRPGTVYWGSL
jgi:hypothetical protein